MKRPADLSGLDIVAVPPRVEASLWRRLRFESERACRAQLFDRYRNLARAIAAQAFGRRPRNGVERGDLEQFAYAGLLEAIDRYDPLRGVPFSAFARRRIAGCASDGAARFDEAGAQDSYRRRVQAERARSLATSDEGGPGDPLRALSDLAGGLAIGLMLEGTGVVEPEGGADHRPNAYDSLAWREMQALLAAAVADLPEREAAIIRQHYEHGVSFTHIAHLLGVSKGRVSQLHHAALARLRVRTAAQR